MLIINVLLALVVATSFFLLGKKFSDDYHEQTQIQVNEALERQFLRLSVNMDADDPCKPYVAHRQRRSQGISSVSGELLTEFGQKMEKDGKATILIHK